MSKPPLPIYEQYKSGEDYAKACYEYYKAHQTTAQKLDAIGIEAICDRVAQCTQLRVLCEDYGVSMTRLLAWLDGHAEQYARAREAQADKLVEDLLDIVDSPAMLTTAGGVDGGDVSNRRLKYDARRWLAGKMNAKKYGDKVAIGGADDLPPVAMSLNVLFGK